MAGGHPVAVVTGSDKLCGTPCSFSGVAFALRDEVKEKRAARPSLEVQIPLEIPEQTSLGT